MGARGSGRGLVARLVFKTRGEGAVPPGRFDSYAAPSWRLPEGVPLGWCTAFGFI